MQAEFLLSREQNHRLDVGEARNRAYRLHFHSHIELCLVTEGEIEVWINDRRKLLGAGEFSVAWSYDAHAYRTPKESHSLSIIIPPDYFGELLPQLNNRCAGEPFLSDSVLFEKILGWVREAKASTVELTRKGCVYMILGTLLEQMPSGESPTQQADHQLPSRVLLYLNENFREDLTLASVALALGYHPSYLSRMFKSTLRIGFNHYLTLLRLREAVLLMRDGEHTVTDAAFESGFQSLRTFYRAFQAEFDCTPRDYFK